MNTPEITIAQNIVYQMNDDLNGNIHHNVKHKVPRDLVVAINGKNRNFKGFFRIVMKVASKGFGNQIYFQFWVLEKDGDKEDYDINSKYENVEIYFDLQEGVNFIEIALNKFNEILMEAKK